MRPLIVFDLDGTLVDSRRDIAASANLLLASCGADPLPEDLIGRMVGDGAAALVARAFAASGRERPTDALERFLSIYDQHLLEHTRPYPGIPGVLAALGPRARLAVLTNKPRRATCRVLSGLDLASYFPESSIIAGDAPFPRKPDPAGLRHLMSEAGTDHTQTILVGDSPVDWQTARNASTRVCLVRYGFGFEAFATEPQNASICIIGSPDDLLSGLLNLL